MTGCASAPRPAGLPAEPAGRTRCEVWTRVMGYHRPVSFWNVGKRQEHADRTHFREPPHA